MVKVLRLTGPNVSLLVKKFQVFHDYLKTMNILQIFLKWRNYSIHFLRTSAPYFTMTLNFRELCLTKQMKGYNQLKLPMMTYLK